MQLVEDGQACLLLRQGTVYPWHIWQHAIVYRHIDPAVAFCDGIRDAREVYASFVRFVTRRKLNATLDVCGRNKGNALDCEAIVSRRIRERLDSLGINIAHLSSVVSLGPWPNIGWDRKMCLSTLSGGIQEGRLGP